MLLTDQFELLDAQYSAVQAAYRAGTLSEDDLRARFRAFYATDAGLEPHYAIWVQRFPRSYVAHLARGIYYKKVGWNDLSGNNVLSGADFESARQILPLQIAQQEFALSLTLEKKPLLTYLHWINVLAFQNEPQRVRSLYLQAMALDSRSFIIRENYLDTLMSRAGGSTAQMQAFVDDSRASGLTRQQIGVLEAKVAEDEAWVHRYREFDLDSTLKDYDRAAALDPGGSCLPCGPVGKKADLLRSLNRYSEAAVEYSRLLSLDPQSVHALDGRGAAFFAMHQVEAAMIDFTAAADLGDDWAQDMLGRVYLLGREVPQDRALAIRYLKLAAAQGNSSSIALLPLAEDERRTPVPLPP
jgi:TPR repeat protein